MARLSYEQLVEREMLALLRRVAAGEQVPPEQVEAAKLALSTVKARERKRTAAKATFRRHKALKQQQAAEKAAEVLRQKEKLRQEELYARMNPSPAEVKRRNKEIEEAKAKYDAEQKAKAMQAKAESDLQRFREEQAEKARQQEWDRIHGY